MAPIRFQRTCARISTSWTSVLGEGTVFGQHAPELLECHRASIVGISGQETHLGR
jgi:hypothetical protein